MFLSNQTKAFETRLRHWIGHATDSIVVYAYQMHEKSDWDNPIGPIIGQLTKRAQDGISVYVTLCEVIIIVRFTLHDECDVVNEPFYFVDPTWL